MKKVLVYFAALFILFASFPKEAFVFNEALNCNGGVCTTLINDLPDGASTLTENINVQLTFGVFKSGNRNDTNVCPANYTLYRILRHYSGSNYTYTKNGAGAAFTHEFGSGRAGQQNKYEAIFYCDNVGGITSNQVNIVDPKLETIRTSGRVFNVTPFNMTTVAPPAAPAIVFSPRADTYAPNTRVVITATNLPSTTLCGQGNASGYTMEINLNGTPKPFYCFPYPFIVKAGAVEGTVNMTGGSNQLSVIVKNSAGTVVAINNLSFKVGSATSTTTPTTGTTTGAGGQPLPTDKLYNPLPFDELTATFLFIARGFLGIVAIWSVIFIIVGGFRMVVAAGNEEAIAQGKKTVTWAVIGLVVALLSFSIIAIVQNLLGANIQ